MKKHIKAIGLFLAAITLCSFTLVGCKNENENESSSSNTESTDNNEVVVGEGYFVENSKTDYVIVIPQNDSGKYMTAASELAYFWNLASEVNIQTVTDLQLEYSDTANYISLGNTNIFESSALQIDVSDMKKSDYVIKSKGESVFILDNGMNSSRGVLYGVYKFLEETIGYKVYAADEYVYEQCDDIVYMQFDLKQKMSVEARNVAFYTAMSDSLYNSRLGMVYEADEWIIFGHSQMIHLIRYDSYGAAHPEWFTPDGRSLCLSNREMLDEMITKVIHYINASDRNRIMIGQPDHWDYCTCDNCTALMNEYGGYSGISLWMVNEIANAVDAYLAVNAPDREPVYYYIFAYQQSEAPPAKRNEQGEWAVYKDGFVPNEHVGIVYAPIGVDFSVGLTDKLNTNAYDALKGWATVLGYKNLSVWSYCTNFHNYITSYNNFASLQDTYRVYADFGCDYVFDQGPVETGYASFEALRIYLQSQLLMDVEQNVEDIVVDFMQNYYKEAWNEIYEYYTLLNTWYQFCKDTMGMRGTIYFGIGDRQYWPKELVDELSEILTRAINKIEPLQNENPAMYNKLYDRIMHESLSTIYMKITFYKEYYSTSEINKMIDDFGYYCGKFDIFCTREGAMDIDSLVASWRE